jgi:uncharacterized protein with WD repeat
MHPRQRKIVIQIGQTIKVMDTKIHRFVGHFQTLKSHSYHFNRACLSPCGTWTFMATSNGVTIVNNLLISVADGYWTHIC